MKNRMQYNYVVIYKNLMCFVNSTLHRGKGLRSTRSEYCDLCMIKLNIENGCLAEFWRIGINIKVYVFYHILDNTIISYVSFTTYLEW